MWRPPLNFITLHYAYIVLLGIIGLIIIYPYGNISAADAYFFGVSASTESGLNTIDVKDLKNYQQLVIYFSPIISNLGFINIIVVVVRLTWFEKRLKLIAPRFLKTRIKSQTTTKETDCEANLEAHAGGGADIFRDNSNPFRGDSGEEDGVTQVAVTQNRIPHVFFGPDPKPSKDSQPDEIYVPAPREFNQEDENARFPSTQDGLRTLTQRSQKYAQRTGKEDLPAFNRISSSIFVVGASRRSQDTSRAKSELARLPSLSSHASVGRNSKFYNLTKEDRETLGGLEYRALKLLLKIVVGYFFGLHLFGAICLSAWIRYAPSKYRDYLEECGQNKTWWAFYSSQTMVNNLGFTLTPDSMIAFQDATFPMLLMSFLAYAGNTCYPVLLRLLIWITSKLVPKDSSLKEPLEFLLQHPRRCYTLLFPSRPTWILFGILFAMNLVDVVLIIVLDLDNPAVNNLSAGPRILASIFQSASARHTGTATFNLADVNPAVQFSLLVMMYIAVYPIAISVRASNTYEEKSLGIYSHESSEMNENNGMEYVMMHLRNQLSFDLWYIFLGIFCICIAEADKIVDDTNPAFSVFAIFFEVVSAYGNVGLSLGHPSVLTSLCGKFTTFSKLVICVMMIRGRHRGLPYELDRAIMLPNERLLIEDSTERNEYPKPAKTIKLNRYHTK